MPQLSIPWIVKEYGKTHARAGETNTGRGLCSDSVTNTEWLLAIGGRKDKILELAGQAVEWEIAEPSVPVRELPGGWGIVLKLRRDDMHTP